MHHGQGKVALMCNVMKLTYGNTHRVWIDVLRSGRVQFADLDKSNFISLSLSSEVRV